MYIIILLMIIILILIVIVNLVGYNSCSLDKNNLHLVLIFISLIIITSLCTCYFMYNIKQSFPIDVVYTWAGETNSLNKRLSNNNELKYSLRSVMKHAPWVNKIYIVMNPPAKIPSWFNDEYKKKIVLLDQTDTFPKDYPLPCYNSNAIETTLPYIPELSEHFIYFNDDFFLGKDVKYTDFFTTDGKALVSDTILEKLQITKGENNLNISKYPMSAFGFYPHAPISLLKSQILKYHKEYPEYVEWVRSIKYRNNIGCSECKINNMICPCAQQHHIVARYMYDNKKAKLLNYESVTMFINSRKIYKLKYVYNKKPKFFCINDTTSNENKKKYIKKRLDLFFNKMYPEKPFFEI